VRMTTAPEFTASGSPSTRFSASEPLSSPVPPAPTAPGGTAATSKHDERTVASVLATLHQQFPLADPETVQALVAAGFAEFEAARVTTFVPVLVLRACQEQLRGA